MSIETIISRLRAEMWYPNGRNKFDLPQWARAIGATLRYHGTERSTYKFIAFEGREVEFLPEWEDFAFSDGEGPFSFADWVEDGRPANISTAVLEAYKDHERQVTEWKQCVAYWHADDRAAPEGWDVVEA
jgi:hypothetical protein